VIGIKKYECKITIVHAIFDPRWALHDQQSIEQKVTRHKTWSQLYCDVDALMHCSCTKHAGDSEDALFVVFVSIDHGLNPFSLLPTFSHPSKF
jgi:hypothetical protein